MKIYLATLLLSMPIALIADPANLKKDGELSLYASFDEGMDAEISMGPGDANAAEGLTRVAGVNGKGQALSFRVEGLETAAISYRVKEAFDPDRGTLMFWFRPGWDGGEDQGRYTLAWITMENSDKYFALHRSFHPESPRSLFCNFHWDNVLQLDTRERFVADEWVHVAITWSEENAQYALYLNGTLVLDQPWKALPKDGDYRPLTLKLGSFYAADSPINADYDELFLFRRALSPAEVHHYVQQINEQP